MLAALAHPNLVIAPVMLPLATALVALLPGRPTLLRRWLVGTSAAVQLGLALLLVALSLDQPLVLAAGGWPAPFGIVLVADPLAAIMLSLGALISLAALLFGYAELPVRDEHPLRLPLAQFMMAGINLSFVTADLFNLFVAFEVMLIASYALLTLEADDWDIRQAFPYLAINVLGGALFLIAAGFAYGVFGTLNFAELALRADAAPDDPRLLALALLLATVFGIKAGLFPLYYWLPNSYPILPSPVGALYAGLLTKVGVYALLRIFGQVLPPSLTGVHTLLAWLAGATMVLAVLGAVSREFVRGILSFHILSQIGYMVLAIALFTPVAMAAAVFYVIHHIVVKSTLFMVGGVITMLNRTDALAHTGGLWRAAPVLSLVFLVQALSLAGVPPLSGFWGKYLIVVEGLRAGAWVLVGCSLVASVLTLFSMLKIWNSVFWRDAPPLPAGAAAVPADRRHRAMTAVTAGLAVVSLGIGFGAEPVLRLSQAAVASLTDRAGYVERVLGAPAGPGAPGIAAPGEEPG